MSLFKNKFGVFITALFCCFLWGSAAPCIKLGYELLGIQTNDVGSILVFAGLRFALAGILVLIFGSIVQKKILFPKKETIQAVSVLALCQTLGQYYFYYMGLAYTSGVHGAIITGTGAFLSLLVASLIFRYERLYMYKVLGCIMGFFGILIMNLNKGSGVSFSLFGDLFIFISQIFCAFSASFIKMYTQKYNAVYLSGYQFLMGGILLIIAGYSMTGISFHANISGLLLLFYLAFVSACAYTLWGLLLQQNDISKIGIYNCLVPIVGVLLSSVMLKEDGFSMLIILSLVFVAFGIYFVTKKEEGVDV